MTHASQSPPRPSHQLGRSISELPPATVTKTNSSHHSHLHRPNREEKGWPLAGQTLSPDVFETSLTPVSTKSTGRKTSSGLSLDTMGARLPVRDIGDDEVKHEEERAVIRAKELGKSVANLYTQSHETTRHLDDTYYSVLEKVSTMQSTLASLKDLAVMMRSLDGDFKSASEELVRDMEIQLGTFGEFKEQQKKMEGLEGRIILGRQKVQKLGARVDMVRQRVERWEVLEEEWQQRTRKRLKILWSVMVVILIVVLGLLIFHYTPKRSHASGFLKRFNASTSKDNISETGKDTLNGTLHLKRPATDGLAALRTLQNRTLEEDARLHAFDEL